MPDTHEGQLAVRRQLARTVTTAFEKGRRCTVASSGYAETVLLAEREADAAQTSLAFRPAFVGGFVAGFYSADPTRPEREADAAREAELADERRERIGWYAEPAADHPAVELTDDPYNPHRFL